MSVYDPLRDHLARFQFREFELSFQKNRSNYRSSSAAQR